MFCQVASHKKKALTQNTSIPNLKNDHVTTNLVKSVAADKKFRVQKYSVTKNYIWGRNGHVPVMKQ